MPIELARFGGKALGVFAISGRYDAALITEFEDEAGCLAFSLAATAEGQYVETLRIYERSELERAESIARKALHTFEEDMTSGDEAFVDGD